MPLSVPIFNMWYLRYVKKAFVSVPVAIHIVVFLLIFQDGFTPLAVALQQGHNKVVAVLVENDSRGKVEQPATDIAAKNDDMKTAALPLQDEHTADGQSKVLHCTMYFHDKTPLR